MEMTKYLLLSTSLLGLAACGGSNAGDPIDRTITIGNEEQTAREFSADRGDAGDVIQVGDTLTARQIAMAGIQLDYNDSRGGPTQIMPMTEFTVRLNSDGELTYVMNGTEWAFTAADRYVESGGEVYGYENEDRCGNDDECVSLFAHTGEIDDIKTNGQGYHEIYSSQSNQLYGDGALNLRAYAAVGTETRDEDLATLPIATYNGRARIDGYPSSGFVDNGTSRTRLRGDMTMMADFGAGTISGSISDLRLRDAGMSDDVDIAGSISMESTNFTVNGFNGALSGDAALTASTGYEIDGSSSYKGVFFGPNAEEVGGVIEATGIDDEGASWGAVGYFTGDQY